MKKEFLFNQAGKLIGVLIITEKSYQLFDNGRNLNQKEYTQLLDEFHKIEEIEGYNTFSFFDQQNDNSKSNRFILYSGNINDL